MHARIQIYWCRSSIFCHLKLELLTQFPASNDEKYINVVYIWRKFVSFYGYVHWRMTTEISVMYGSEKVKSDMQRAKTRKKTTIVGTGYISANIIHIETFRFQRIVIYHRFSHQNVTVFCYLIYWDNLYLTGAPALTDVFFLSLWVARGVYHLTILRRLSWPSLAQPQWLKQASATDWPRTKSWDISLDCYIGKYWE